MEKKRQRKKIIRKGSLLISLLCVFVMGASGCMKRSTIEEKMVAYMNEKYEDTFVFASPFGGGPGKKAKQILVNSEKFPEAKIWVQYGEQDGKTIYTDNYVSYKYEEQTRQLLRELLEDAFQSKAVVQYDIGTKGTENRFDDNTTFEEYISSYKADIGFQACVLKSGSNMDREALEQRLKEQIESRGLIAAGKIYFIEKRETFDEVSALSLREFAGYDFSGFDDLYFDMSAANTFRAFEWSVGNAK